MSVPERISGSSLALALAAISVACASGGGGAAETSGERLYEARCGACHQPRPPSERTREGWERAVQKYGPRARLRGEEERRVLEFLRERAKDAPSRTGEKR